MIPFNKPFIVGKELFYIARAVLDGHLAGDGAFTKKCNAWLEEKLGASRALLTHSCTAALEMAALLCDVGEGDEVIMPSFTFVSTANAFVLRGAKPVFVDIRPDTLNLDENLLDAAITDRTKIVVPVHYAGVACEMNAIGEIAERHGLYVVEDAAQGLMSTYGGRPLGTLGQLGCFSFHETKNFISGEGGALVINDPSLIERAEIIREKGTNRSKFFRGEVDKYTWIDLGSSYLPSEIVAAFLYAQLEEAEVITMRRHAVFNRYQERLVALERKGLLRLPVVPETCGHNAHMFYLLLPTAEQREGMLAHLRQQEVHAVFHYLPLHASPMGQRLGHVSGKLSVTEDVSERLVRLPCYFELDEAQQDHVLAAVESYFVG